MYSNCLRCNSSAKQERLTADSSEKLIDEVFRTNDKYVLVKNIPAQVCTRCGEESFSAKTAESIRLMVNGEATPEASISLDVFTFAPTN